MLERWIVVRVRDKRFLVTMYRRWMLIYTSISELMISSSDGGPPWPWNETGGMNYGTIRRSYPGDAGTNGGNFHLL
jgi:hypothetical protein